MLIEDVDGEATVILHMIKGLSREAAQGEVQLDAMFAQVNPRLQEQPWPWVTDDSEDIEEEY